jgi:predicted RNase H-like HicB family nuclease
MRVETEKEEDERWIAEVPELPGAMGYGSTRKEAIAKFEARYACLETRDHPRVPGQFN